MMLANHRILETRFCGLRKDRAYIFIFIVFYFLFHFFEREKLRGRISNSQAMRSLGVDITK
jgi:hypothetical protein